MAVITTERPTPSPVELRCPRCGAFFGYPEPHATGVTLRCYDCGYWFRVDTVRKTG